MASYTIRTKKGRTYDIDLADGDDINQVVAEIEAQEAAESEPAKVEAAKPESPAGLPSFLSRTATSISSLMGGRENADLAKKLDETQQAPSMLEFHDKDGSFRKQFDSAINQYPEIDRINVLRDLAKGGGLSGAVAKDRLATAEAQAKDAAFGAVARPGEAQLLAQARRSKVPTQVGPGTDSQPLFAPDVSMVDRLMSEKTDEELVDQQWGAQRAGKFDPQRLTDREFTAKSQAEVAAKHDAEAKETGDKLFGWMPDMARDWYLSATKVAPMAAEFATSVISFLDPMEATGAERARQFFKAMNTAADSMKSDADRAATREFAQILADPETDARHVLGFLLANPGHTGRAVLETTASLAPGLMLGKAASATVGAVSRAGVQMKSAETAARMAEEIAALSSSAAARGAMAGETALGAASVYHQLREQGYSAKDAYGGAGLTAIGYAAANRLTGGGLEAALAAGRSAKRLPTMFKEGAQEYAQSWSEATGEAAGSGESIDIGKANKQAVYEAALGAGHAGLLGGEKSNEQILSEQINQGVNGSRWVDGSADAYARLAFNPDPTAVSPAATVRPVRVEEQRTSVITPEEIASAPLPPARTQVEEPPRAPTQVQTDLNDADSVLATLGLRGGAQPSVGATAGLPSADPAGVPGVAGPAQRWTGSTGPVPGAGPAAGSGSAVPVELGARRDAVAPIPYTGKRADGYATQEEAQQAIDSGRPQARHPGLDWTIEQTPAGTFVPMGRQPTQPAASLGQQTPSATIQQQGPAPTLRSATVSFADPLPSRNAKTNQQTDQRTGQPAQGLPDLGAESASNRSGYGPGLAATNAERVAAANTVFAAARQRLADEGRLNNSTPLADLQPADEAHVRSLSPVLEAVSEALGTDPVAVAKSASNYDGVNWVGRTIVNVDDIQKPAVFVAAHESIHSLQNLARNARRAAESGATPTQDQADALRIWEPMEQAIWDMVPTAERTAYAAKALGVKLEEMPKWMDEPANQEELRREFMADFGAKRLTNPDDVRALAQREPKMFGDFARKMIDGLSKVITTLRGKYKALGKDGANDADSYIKNIQDLQSAKLMWQDTLISWKKRGGASAAPVKIETQTQAQVGTTAAGPGGSQAMPESDPSMSERIPDEPGLSDEERVIEARFRDAVESDTEGMLQRYAQLPDTFGGKLVNTDEARELSEDYARDNDSRATLARAVHGPSSWLAKQQWSRLMSAPPKAGRVLILGGGGGSGKTSSLSQVSPGFSDKFDAIYDTTLASEGKAVKAIEEALASGRSVEVAFTYRDPFESIANGIIPRAARIGRTVPLDVAAKAHEDAPGVLASIYTRYADDDRVRFRLLDNTRGPRQVREIAPNEAPTFDYNGLTDRAIAEAVKRHEKGEINEAVLRGLYPGNAGQDHGQVEARSAGSQRDRNSQRADRQPEQGAGDGGARSQGQEGEPEGSLTRRDDGPSYSERDAKSISAHKMHIDREERVTIKTVKLSTAEQALVDAAAESIAAEAGVPLKSVKAAIKAELTRKKASYPQSKGWAPLNFKGAGVERDEDKMILRDEDGKPVLSLTYDAIPYNFHVGASGKNDPKTEGVRVEAMALRLKKAAMDLVARREKGDAAAEVMLRQAGWYKNMRQRLRAEFGGFGDFVADLLGATSPNTPVRTNWEFTIEALKMASNGAYDEIMPAVGAWWTKYTAARDAAESYLMARVNEGKSKVEVTGKKAKGGAWERQPDPVYADLLAKEKEASVYTGPEPRRENGKRYGINTKNVLSALGDLWRVVEKGTAPKARNFSGNLIGFRTGATIDVWAARLLRRMANEVIAKGEFPRIPPPAEKGVGGEHLSQDSIGGEFGFGQAVFNKAAEMLRRSGVEEYRNLGDDDLQAIVWFLEKELWTKNNWTTVAGEGGSFEQEADLAGSMERDTIKELRRIIDSTKSSPEMREAARRELAKHEGTLQRFTGGLSVQQSAENQGVDSVPSDADMVGARRELESAAAADQLVAFRAFSTLGRYGADERSFDIEGVTRAGYDLMPLHAKMREIAKRANQDSFFTAKALQPGDEVDLTLHRPGIEIFFSQPVELAKAEPLLEQLREKGVEFFTFITDGRRTPDALAGAMPKVTGVRMIAMPEFMARYGDAEAAALATADDAQVVNYMQQREKDLRALRNRVDGIPGVSYAEVGHYEVNAEFKEQYDGNEAGAPQGNAGQVGGRGWAGLTVREGLARSNPRNGAAGSSGLQDGAGDLRGNDGQPQRGGAGDEASYSRRSDAAGDRRDRGVPEGSEQGSPSYGVARPGAAAPVEAVHFSQQRRSSLTSASYGSGLRGAEMERVMRSSDSRLRQRVYFYVNQGTGIRPESGVGAHAHRVTLNNLYDTAKGEIKGAGNDFESAVLDAGYDGYLVRLPGSQSGQAVLLGAHNVPVEYLGLGAPGKTQPAAISQAAAPSSRMEGGLLASTKPIDVAAIKGLEQIRAVAPSFKFEYGKAKVDPAEAEVASAMLKELGSEVSFSARWKDDTNRVQFGPGAALYDRVAPIVREAMIKTGTNYMPDGMKSLHRRMKLDIEKSVEVATKVAKETFVLSEGERSLISDVVEQELAAGVTPPQRVVQVAAGISQIMEQQTNELVALGMLSPESADMWRGKYLPRYYESKIRNLTDPWAKAVKGLLGRTSAMKGIKGQRLKGRGLFATVPVGEMQDWIDAGYEVRDKAYDPNTSESVTVWRDFTRDERDSMGEMRDGGFRFVMGYMQMQRDIALGRFFDGMAGNQELASKAEKTGWIRVPTTNIDGVGVKRYGKLAGMWVPPEVFTHLEAMDSSTSDLLRSYRAAMSYWKEAKTVLNPVSHMNNVLGNLTMAHFAGVSYWDAHKYAGAAVDLMRGASMVREAHDAGLFLGGMTQEELIQSMPKELQKLVDMQKSKGRQWMDALWTVLTLGLRKPMGKAYEFEDTFFKYLIYRDARKQGMDPEAAVNHTQKYIVTYDDLPRNVQRVRDFAMPFVSYQYKVMPTLLETAMKHPHRFLAPTSIMLGISYLAYAIAAGDDDEDWMEALKKRVTDEERAKKANELEESERKNLPPWMKGYAALGIPGVFRPTKAVRLWTDEETKNPVFWDIGQILPGGNMFDTENNMGGVSWPQSLMPNHPLLTTFMALGANKDSFTGKEVVNNKSDSKSEMARKYADWAWKQFTPAIAPGNRLWEKWANVAATELGEPVPLTPWSDATGLDYEGNPVSLRSTAMRTIGLKMDPVDVERNEEFSSRDVKATIREIESRLKKARNNSKISQRALEIEEALAEIKLERLKSGLTVDGEERR